MKTKLHIGELIHKRVQELNLTNSQFANLINCHRTNVNNFYKQETIDVGKLKKISEVLGVDFFKYYVSENTTANEVISKRIELTHVELEKLSKSIPMVVEMIVKD